MLSEGSGGVRVYTEALLQHLFAQNRAHEWRLFVNKRGGDGALADSFQKNTNVTVLQYRFPSKLLNASFRFLRWPRIDALIGGCDVLFSPTMLYTSWSPGTPSVITMHDISFDIVPDCFTFKQNIWHRMVEPRRLCKESTAIIGVSESTKDDIVTRFGIEGNKVHAIHSGVDPRFRPVHNTSLMASLRARYSIPDGKVILQTGTIEPRKNGIATVKAFEEWCAARPKESDGYILVFAGHKGWKSRPFYKAVKHSPCTPRIRVIHDIPSDDMPVLYSIADMFVYPSLYEGFGFPIIEAMACGVPVITSPYSSLGEVGSSAAHYVHPFHIEELREAFSLLSRDSDYVKELRSRGLERTTHFSWEHTARRTMALLESIAKE